MPFANSQESFSKSEIRTSKRPWLGIIADDFTGATDVAGYLVRQGTSTIQIFGLPNSDTKFEDVDCVIIALKSRSIEPDEAVREAMNAFQWLKELQVEHIYFKYCSTFDSTPKGNIGPVADAILNASSDQFLVVCPAAPENSRYVFQGHLFVNDVLLSQSPLKDHPINPMNESDIRRVLAVQSRIPVAHVPLQAIVQGTEFISEELAKKKESKFHVVMDAVSNSDLDLIASALVQSSISSGSAGLAAAIARNRGNTQVALPAVPYIEGGTVLISGSLSEASRNQVRQYAANNPTFEVDPNLLATGMDLESEVDSFFSNLPPGSIPLIHGSIAPEKSKQAQITLGVAKAALLLEEALSRIAVKAKHLGFRKFIVAGGETSGAVVSALQVKAIRIGAEIAIGVPWVVTVEETPLLLVLKSGNFGGPEFFNDAIRGISSQSDSGQARLENG